MIYVLYATKVNIGGWATFTRHLVDSLRLEGEEVELVKIGNRTEEFLRPFGPEHYYRNMSEEDLLKNAKRYRFIIAALGKHYVELAEKLIKLGAGMVIHDTAESSVRMGLKNPWCIRKVLAQLYDGTFIRHPYVRHDRDGLGGIKRGKAIFATSRVDFDKHTDMILDANRLGADIQIVGFENRLYTRFKICPDYPEWVQSTGDHPRTGQGSFELLLGATAMVDLTEIKGDGGGTQYTFLEAWDAGAVPIIGSWWLRKGDDMAHLRNCIGITDAKDLRQTCKEVRKGIGLEEFRKSGIVALKRHTPKIIVPQVLEWLDAR